MKLQTLFFGCLSVTPTKGGFVFTSHLSTGDHALGRHPTLRDGVMVLLTTQVENACYADVLHLYAAAREGCWDFAAMLEAEHAREMETLSV